MFSLVHILTVVGYSLIGCMAMAVQDVAGSYKTMATTHDDGENAGNLDMLTDACQILTASFSAERLTTMGWLGWVGILPILLTSKYATKFGTRRANRHYDQGRKHGVERVTGRVQALRSRVTSRLRFKHQDSSNP